MSIRKTLYSKRGTTTFTSVLIVLAALLVSALLGILSSNVVDAAAPAKLSCGVEMVVMK